MTDFLTDGILWHLQNDGNNSDSSKKISFLPKKKYADINIIAAWAMPGVNGGQTIKIAVLDVDFKYKVGGSVTLHPQLTSTNISTYNFEYSDPSFDTSTIPALDPADPDFNDHLAHGLAVAGLILAKDDSNFGKGVAFNATALLVHGAANAEIQSPISIRYAYNQNCFVINMSYGDASVKTDNFSTDDPNFQEIEKASIYGRSGRGIVFVNSVSNNAIEIGNNVKYLIKVGVSTSNDQFSFSGYGTNLDILAPGQSLVLENFELPSPNPVPIRNYSFYGNRPQPGDYTYPTDYENYFFDGLGSSFSAPIVSGICALMLKVNPNLSYVEIKHILKITAHPIDIENRVPKYKWKDRSNNDIVDADGFLITTGSATTLTQNIVNNVNSGETSISLASTAGFSQYQAVLIGVKTKLVSIASPSITVNDASGFSVGQKISIGSAISSTCVQTYFGLRSFKDRKFDEVETVFAVPDDKIKVRSNSGFLAGQSVSLTGISQSGLKVTENLVIDSVDSGGNLITFTSNRANDYNEFTSLEVTDVVQDNLEILSISGNTITLNTPVNSHAPGTLVELTGSEVVQIKSIDHTNNTAKINKTQKDIDLALQGTVTVRGGLIPYRSDFHGHGRVDTYQAVRESQRLFDNAQLGIFDFDLILRDNNADTGNNVFSGTIDSPDIAVNHISLSNTHNIPLPSHTEPIANKDRYVYVQVTNNGLKPCLTADVRLFLRIVTAGSTPTFNFPTDWLPYNPPADPSDLFQFETIRKLDSIIDTPNDTSLYLFNNVAEIKEEYISAGGSQVFKFKWPKKHIPRRDGNFDTYLMAMITPFDGLKAGALVEDNNNITYKKVTILDYIFFKDSIGGSILNTQLNLSAYSAAQTIPFAIEINSPTAFDFSKIELTIKQKNRKEAGETVTFKNVGGVWKFNGSTPTWASFSATPTTASGTTTNFVGSYKVTPEQKYIEINVKVIDSTAVPAVDFADTHRLKVAVTDVAEIEDTSKGGSKMHFYTNVDGALNLQSASQVFGPYSDPAKPTKDLFRITNLHSATTDPKAYSVCDGLVCAQEINGSLVNLIVKPFQQPAINFAPIKYIIYKGIKRSSLFSGSDIAPSVSNSLAKTIWDSHLNLKASIDQKIADMNAAGAPAGSIPTPLPATPSKSALGLDLTAALDATKYGNDKAIENLFIKADPNFQYPIIRGGWDIGDFDKTSFGVEIVFENIGYKPTLDKVRILENVIELDKITGTETEIVKFESKLAHEEVLNYMDAAAFFGSMYSNRTFIITSLAANTTTNSFTQKNAKEIYNELIKLKFLNKNRTYIDIRNEHSYSFNFYSNYDNSIRIGFDGNSPVNPINYYDNDYGWPLLIIENSKFTSSNSFAKKIEISLPLADISSGGLIENEFPLAYISQGYNDIARGTILKGKNKFIEMTAQIENGTLISSYTKDSIKLEVPNASTTTTEVVASYIRLKYVKRFDPNITSTPAPSTGIVLRAQSYLDNLFVPVNMQIPYNSTNNLNSVVFDEEVYIDATNSDVNFDCIAKIGLAEDANNNVTLFAFATDVRIRNKDLASSRFAISGESNDLDIDYLGQLVSQNPGITASKDELTILGNAVPYISLLDEISGDESFDKVDPDDFFSLVITKAQFDDIILIASDANNFDQKFKIYLAIGNKINGNDDNGVSYTQFDLVLRGYKLFSSDYQVVEVVVTPTITIYSNGNI